jgi:hypothetical protein
MASPEGRTAGMNSYMTRGSTAKECMLCLMDTFHHRLIMLRPDIETIAINHDPKLRTMMINWAMPPVRKDTKWPEMWVFPPENATEVRPRWGWGMGSTGDRSEAVIPGPKPVGGVGQAVTLTYPRHGKRMTTGKIALFDPANKPVDAWTSAPDKAAGAMYPDNLNSLCLIPKKVLAPMTTYTVKAEAVVAGQTVTKTWKFTTGAAPPASAR